MSAIRVLQLISSLEVGGTEKLLLELLQASRCDERISFVVVVMNRHVDPAMRQRLGQIGYPVYYLDRPEGHRHPRYLNELLAVLDRHAVDVIHAHNQGSKWWAMLCKMLRPHCRLVVTLHDVMGRVSAFQRILHRGLVDMHVGISGAVVRHGIQQGLHPMRHIYNGIFCAQFHCPDRKPFVQRCTLGLTEQQPLRILHVGRLDYRVKGQDLLIRAVALCRKAALPVQLTLMGSDTDPQQRALRELQTLAYTLGVSQHVAFVQGQTDVVSRLADADVFVLPSRSEGLGLAALEAMAAGVPVIASRVGGPAELIESGVHGVLFEPNQVQSLFDSLIWLCANPEAVDAMRERAQSRVWMKFDITRMQRAYRQLYADLCWWPQLQAWKWEKMFRRLSNGTAF